ncbi:MAG: protein kinase [Planctomycetota bacterium]
MANTPEDKGPDGKGPLPEECAKTTSSDEKLKRLRSRPPLASERYALEGEVGRGGMGAVLRVRDLDLGRNLAMKVVLGSEANANGKEGATPAVEPQVLQRFLDEAQITSQLDHPGVVPVHELGIDAAGRAYFTMRLVRGETTDQVFQKANAAEDGWTRTRALEVILKVCDTMAFAHRKGVLHRDLKPSNVMVGSFGEVYVMDWGLAKVLGEEERRDLRLRPASEVSKVRTDRSRDESDSDSPLLTMDGAVVGTPSYMAPEQAEGQIEIMDQRTDVYAVGAMLYQLLTDRQPYLSPKARASPYAILAAVMAGPPTPISQFAEDIPPELVAICERAMARRMADRYPSMIAMAEDLRAFVEGRVVRAYENGAWAETKKWVRRNKRLASMAFAFVMVLVGALWASLVLLDWAKEAEATAHSRAAEAEVQRAAAEEATRAKELALAEAQKSLMRSEGLRLVANSKNALSVDPSLAMLLAIEGATRAPGLHANNALLAALRGHNEKMVVRAEREDGAATRAEANETVFAFDATAARIATVARFDGTLRVWDTKGGRVLHEAELPGRSGAYALSFSPDGTLLVAAGSSAWVFDTRTWAGAAVLAPVRPSEPNFSRRRSRKWTASAAFDRSGRRVVANFGDDALFCWDLDSPGEPASFRGHQDVVNAVDVLLEPGLVASASEDHTVRLWDPRSGTERMRFEGHQLGVGCLASNLRVRRMLSGSDDGTARLWDIDTGNCVAVLDGLRLVRAVAFDEAGRHAATGGFDGVARIWNATTGAAIATANLRRGSIEDIAFSPDGSEFAVATIDGGVLICGTETGSILQRCLGHTERVTMVRYSPGGDLLASASWDGTVRLWKRGTEFQRLLPREQGLRLLAAAPSNDMVVVTSEQHQNRRASVVDFAAESELARLETDKSLTSVAFGPRGDLAVAATEGREAVIWSFVTGKPVALLGGHGSSVLHAEFDQLGSHVVTASEWEDVRVFDAATGQQLADRRFDAGWVFKARFDPAGDRIVAACDDGSARVWNWRLEEEAILELVGHGACVVDACFDPTGSRVVTASHDGTSRVWDATEGRQTLVIEVGHAPVLTAVFSLDGTTIATAGEDGVVRLWNATTGTKVRELSGHTGPVFSLRFLAGTPHLLSASDDGSARLWHLETGLVTKKAVPRGRLFASWGNSADLRLLHLPETRKGTVAELRRVAGGAPVCSLVGHLDEISVATFSPDADLVATGSADRTVRVWRTATGELLHCLRGHRSGIKSLSFSLDGKQILSNGYATSMTGRTGRGQVVVWETSTGRKLADLHDLDGASFSADGSQLVACNVGGYRIDVATGGVIQRYVVENEYVDAIAISPDGRLIVTTPRGQPPIVWEAGGSVLARLRADRPSSWSWPSFDATSRNILVRGSKPDIWRVYDCSDFRELLTVPDLPSGVYGGFSLSGDSLEVYSRSGSLWRLPMDLLASARRAIPRPLTTEEVLHYDVGPASSK